MGMYNKQGANPCLFFILAQGFCVKIKCPGAWAIDIAG